ncbi:MAG: Cys-tRNA(Pro) deacylase [Treponemataceae bacterium]|nr:Cys-tRNA(Pro) deacylase [Treponemataceae bacterium]
MSTEKKTNAMRILEAAGIPYSTKTYEVDLENLDAIHASQSAGLPPEQVFKTIVMRNERNEIYVFCVPATTTVNLKKVRSLTSSKEIGPVKPTELLGLTGYIRGGCSPLGMKKKFPTFIDETAVLFDEIYVSAGVRGEQIAVNGETLASLCEAPLESLTL